MTLRRCQHVACLASTLLPAIEARMIVLMMVSSPDEAFVSPFGGAQRLFSSNPIALTAPGPGYPGEAQWPILFDVSMAITAGSQVARAARLGRRLPEAALRSVTGAVTDDPQALAQGGSVMPIGGMGHGHKGQALTIMTEVLSQALGGYGRSETRPESELNSVYLQVMDPAAFCDPADYEREIRHLVQMVDASPADDPASPVRMPGRNAWSKRAQQMANGVTLDPGVLDSLAPYAEAAGLELPARLH
jgi:L-lactate dehydrogenase